jgi:hypothetical protein
VDVASTDWTEMTDGLDIATVDRGVTTGIARPSGGGNFVFGFNSLVAATGAVAFFTTQVDFAPMAKGCSIRGAIKRLPSGGTTGFSPFFFAGGQGVSVNDSAYVLGLADGDPYHLVLKKGVAATGVPDLAPDPVNNGILLRSTQAYTIGAGLWHHVRLDVIVNDNGDVLLQCFENDLSVNPIGGAPVWTAIPGMEEFIDDALQIGTGSPPLTSGRAGFGMHVSDVTRRGAIDHVEVLRQL